MPQEERSRWAGWTVLAPALAVYGWALARPFTLVTSDLGRHLRNGEAIWRGAWGVLTTNFYSYTEPAHAVLNHHWGSGLLFYLGWRVGGFAGLHALFIALDLAALAVALRPALEEAPPAGVSLLGLAFLPLLAQRAEIRPEAFSALLAAFFLDRLWRCERGTLSYRDLWPLPLLEAVWVNLHLYFVLGLALAGALLAADLLGPRRRERAPKSALLLAACAAACLANPFGLSGALEPFTIGRDYGYRLLENQSLFFLQRMFGWPVLAWLEAVIAGVALSFVWAWRRGRGSVFRLLVAAGLSGMALTAYRNVALFALIAWPLAAANAFEALPAWSRGRRAVLASSGALAALLLVSLRLPVLGTVGAAGLGPRPGDSAAADFIAATGLSGPVFNDYDIGGYLIFHLFPRERVFVDNRPEAYSSEFFEKEYVPMQQDEAAWRAALERYGFNLIVFSWHDATPWGQAFLIRRIQDPAWAPVFVDSAVLVLARRDGKNRAAIARYELPRSMFRVTKTSG